MSIAPQTPAPAESGALDAPVSAPVSGEPSRPSVDDLRAALSQMFGAERRLRGREHAPGDLTYNHIRSLHALNDQGGEMTVGQLARSADLNPASVTAMLDHLEASEIVVRTRSTTDRRVCNVSLTPKGRELLAVKTARWRAAWRERLDEFDDAELESAGRVIRALAEMYDAVTAAHEQAAREG